MRGLTLAASTTHTLNRTWIGVQEGQLSLAARLSAFWAVPVHCIHLGTACLRILCSSSRLWLAAAWKELSQDLLQAPTAGQCRADGHHQGGVWLWATRFCGCRRCQLHVTAGHRGVERVQVKAKEAVLWSAGQAGVSRESVGARCLSFCYYQCESNDVPYVRRQDMEQEVPFDPEAVLHELYALESIVASVAAGNWDRQVPKRGRHAISGEPRSRYALFLG